MSEIVVLGAGMVGVTTALALQERGHSVVLVDRSPPGREASYGNAGIIQLEVMEPYAFPRSLAAILKIALGRGNAVRYSLSALPSAALPLMSYYRNSAPRRHAKVSAIYRQLIRQCGPDHDRLICATNSEHLIRRTGYIQMQRGAAEFEADAALADHYVREYGVQASILGNDDLRRTEPALKINFSGAVHWTESRSCSDPGGLVTAYANHFTQRGGTIRQSEVIGLSKLGQGWQVAFSGGVPLVAQHVVIALGAWSPDLLQPLGYTIPMLRKRGYHQHYKAAEPPIRPLFDVAASALYCPMQQGVRVTTGAEIAPFRSKGKGAQLAKAVTFARQALDLGDPVEKSPWSGWRPCLPDMLPAVGPVPGQSGLWCNFGHGHQGFTLGPTTAKILANWITGDADVAAFRDLSPARFF